MKIGIFGGTFNPVHSEHVSIVKTALKQLNLDKIIIVPVNIPPHKNVKLVSAEDRVNMLKIAFNGIEKTEISDYEIKKSEKSYTFATVEHFKKEYPSSELYLIIGGDMLLNFKYWKNPEIIIQNCTVAYVGREDYNFDENKEREFLKEKFKKDFVFLNYVGKRDSSSKIRVFASLGLPLEGVCIDGVAEYIKEHDLYSGDKYTDFIKKVLTKNRLVHTAGVIVCALCKAKELGLDEEKVRISATLHDCAKYLNPSSFKDFVLPEGVPEPVVHAFLGAYVAENVLGIKDGEIIDAIRYHTSGKAEMSDLSKLIFVADMVEDGRDYQGVEKLRELYYNDFDRCFKTCIEEEVIHLLNKKQSIYYETLNAYDYYVKNKRG